MAARRRRPHFERHDGYTLLVGAPVPPQAEAITLGRLVLVRRRSADNHTLIAHELVHVRQFAELGPARFLVRYLWSYLRGRLAGYGHMAAYRRIPLEIEASWLSRLHTRRALEPGATGAQVPEVSQSRAPRGAVSQRLQGEAERLARDALAGTLLEGATLPGRIGADDGRATGPARGHARRARVSTSRRRKRNSPPNR